MRLMVRNLDVFYGAIHALRRVTLHVDAGEIVALVGANGAGKTTMLATISGILRPRQGSVRLGERELTHLAPEAVVAAGLSHVPEGRRVFRPLSVEDNLRLGAYRRRAQRQAIAEDLERIYAMFPILRERRRQPAGTLSGGEQQMLAMGRALMARPRVLLLDEPSMGLAPLVVQEILNHIQNLRQKAGLTVLVVEQNARAALAIADRGYVLENGRIVLHGTAEELLNNHDVQRAYLGREREEACTGSGR